MQTTDRSFENSGTSRNLRRLVRILGVVLACLSGYGIAGAQEIHLKARTITAGAFAADSADARRAQRREIEPVHQLIQFDHAPGTADLEALQAAGIRVVAMVPDNAVMVVAPRRIGRDSAVRSGEPQWLGELAAGDKLSSSLNRIDEVPAIVEFHADVDAAAQQSVAAAENVTLQRPAQLLANHAIVTAS